MWQVGGVPLFSTAVQSYLFQYTQEKSKTILPCLKNMFISLKNYKKHLFSFGEFRGGIATGSVTVIWRLFVTRKQVKKES
jgi:hypothetical protein